MKNKIAALFIAFTFSGILCAQTGYTLSECIHIGLENNYGLKISRNEQQVSSNNATLANAGYLPTLDLSAGYNADLGSSSGELATGESVSSSNNFDQNINAGINLNWTIFDGFNISSNYKMLKEMEKMGEVETRITLENLIADITAEYYNFVQQRIRLNNYRNAVKLSKERLRIAEARYHIGDLSRLDYQQAKVDFNADSAQFIKQHENVITSRIALNELMAIEQVYSVIELDNYTIETNDSLDFAMLWNGTLENNANILLAAQNQTLAQLDYKRVTSRDYPYVRLNAGYNYSLNIYDNSNYNHNNAWGGSAGITVGFKLWDGNRRRQRANANIAIENARLQKEQIELKLKADLGTLWEAYRNYKNLRNLERQNLITARENHEIATERFMLGDLSGIEMREAQQSLLEAEERLLSAEYSTKVCEISLMLISGNITEYIK